MVWQLRDPGMRQAIHAVTAPLVGRCALVGTVGVQVHLAAQVGLDMLGPPAHAIELVTFVGAWIPAEDAGGVPVVEVDALGFAASVESATRQVLIDGEPFPVASPEHILGLQLVREDLSADRKWSCFLLMRTFAGRFDLEDARGFLKRTYLVDRQSLLAELAYLAA